MAVIHKAKSIANGICFSDTESMPDWAKRMLTQRSLLWATEFKNADDGLTYGGDIVAASLAQAEVIARHRGLGEDVIGMIADYGSMDKELIDAISITKNRK